MQGEGSEVVVLSRSRQNGGTPGDAHTQNAFVERGREGGVVEVAAEAQAEFVVKLDTFQIGGGEVDSNDVGLAADHDKVRSANHYFDSGGVHAGQENGQFNVVAVGQAIVVRAAGLSVCSGFKVV